MSAFLHTCVHLANHVSKSLCVDLTTQKMKRLAHKYAIWNTPCFFSLTSAGELGGVIKVGPISKLYRSPAHSSTTEPGWIRLQISTWYRRGGKGGNWAVSAELAHTEKHFYLFMTEINLWLGGPCEKQLWKHIDTETHLLRVMAAVPAAASALYSLPVLCGNTSNDTNSLLSDVSFTPPGEVSH